MHIPILCTMLNQMYNPTLQLQEDVSMQLQLNFVTLQKVMSCLK